MPGVRTAKATLAVVASYLIAEVLHISDHPVVALLVVQLTLYRTFAHGIGQVGGVLAGVVVALGVANLAGFTWWSLGAVVAAARPAPIRGADQRDAGAGGGRWPRPASWRR
ncbi:MAG TPA: aromatic acid exporter family protein [Actinophytocola sp.]|nr:aromatic acid exporter family protein [Actinophytocola sp.]